MSKRLAIIVTHPIQYYAPLYRQLAARSYLAIKVFFTWHAGREPKHDAGFGQDVAWDIPLTQGYEFEMVPNVARRPGSDHFFGIRNPELISRVRAWKPDAVHVTGYAYASHLYAMRGFHRLCIPVLFRGDSHLLDQVPGLRWATKKRFLRTVYQWTKVCLYVGRNNYDYYRRFGVGEEKLFYCPHSIEVARFAQPNSELEARARAWKAELKIPEDKPVLVYAGKFEAKKQPLQLMEAMNSVQDDVLLLLVGNGILNNAILSFAEQNPDRFKVLPFQNQTMMPLVYRLGDAFVLPSAYGETWGLAINEAIACGRPVIASDRVGCAADLISNTQNGFVFEKNNWPQFRKLLSRLLESAPSAEALRQRAWEFDTQIAADRVCEALQAVA